MPTGRSGLVVVAAPNGKLYAIGGAGGLKSVEEYDPATNTWTTMTSMPTGRSGLGGAVAPNGKLYAIGGQGSCPSFSRVEEYTPPQ